ncbi:MAG: C25 family cysteine peptidase [Candidatus Krumholzibacteria bacterium]|nr:C25 family cysteine peptidase [Candidatus Krumholzibacteria bacterium]MDP6668646.1 C25 family cysteine peptidase [Candidatus Krumholzibacteria bacterium]
MRLPFRYFTLFLLLCLFPGVSLQAATYVHEAQLTEYGKDLKTVKGGAPALVSTEHLRQPQLPLESLRYLIPAEEKVSSLRIEVRTSDELILEELLPEFQGLPGSEGTIASLPAMRSSLYPAEHLISYSTASLRGYRIAEVLLAPLQYEKAWEGGAVLHRLQSCKVIIETEPDPSSLFPLRQSGKAAKRSREEVLSLVLNPEAIDSYAPSSMRSSDRGVFQPRDVPSIEGSGVDMVIVTDAEFASIFQSLANYKTGIGISTVVRDIDWIRSHYPQGADLQQTIRSFLQDAYENWGVQFVLLAGDTPSIPARYIRSFFHQPWVMLPSDLYYAQLDGDWNADGDEFFGEPTYGSETGDGDDMYADVFLGRLPVTNVAEAQLMVDKIITYSETPDPGYAKAITFLGEVLFPADWEITDPVEWITSNGADYCQEIIEQSVPGDMDLLRLYETYWLYEGSYPELLVDVHADLEERAHLVHHMGHGFRYNMSCGEGNFMASDALAMQNGLDHLISVYAMNCTSCAFDYSCLGEAFLLAENGGSISTIGSVREAFPQTADIYQETYYAALLADSSSLGGSFTWSHNKWAIYGVNEGSHRWSQLSCVLFGDPSIEIWLDNPESMDLALTAPFDLDSESLSLSLSQNGSPVGDARITAIIDAEDRALGTTDASGLLTLPLHADSPGTLQLAAVANNCLITRLDVPVMAGSGPRLSVENLQVEDNPMTDLAISGNADGLVDAGETFRLSFRVLNEGSQTASNLQLGFNSPGGEFLILESSHSHGGDLAGWGSLDLDLVFLVQAPTNLEDGLHALIGFDFTFDSGTQSDASDLAIHAPLPRLFRFFIDDSSGNGDGEPNVGETYRLLPEWKNYGSTITDAWSVEAFALDAAGSVLSSPIALPAMGLMERTEGGEFLFSESDVSSANRFELVFSGPWGGERRDTITVRRPTRPMNLLLDSSFASTVIDMVWDNPDTTAAGFLVYRSLQSGGPYELVSSESLDFTYFRNDGLSESTDYYFLIEGISESGFRSLPTEEAQASTNPSMLEGWPLETAWGTACSPVIGDIDGQEGKEIVVGSNRIYAWHADGTEVIDGDNDSGSYGVLSDEGDLFTASLALAQLEPMSPGLEIVGFSRNTNELYVFRGTGDVAPGWPVSLPDWAWATPAVADIDADGTMEIAVLCLNSILYIFNHDGSSYLSGAGGVFATGIGYWSRSSPALCQLDDDDELEVVVGSKLNKVYAWNHDGSTLPGWPVSVGGAVYSSPAIGDLDGDEVNEVVFLTDAGYLYAVRNTGMLFNAGFPVPLSNTSLGLPPSPAIVDFEGDGQMEIVAAGIQSYTSMNVIVCDNQGNVLPGWPVHLEDSSEASPVVVDLDGDRELEIMLGTERGLFYAWNLDGSLMSGFPILTQAEVRSSPTIDDLDGNLTVDVALMGWDAFVYVWDMPTPYYNGLAQWKMFRANPARTGVFTPEVPLVGVDEDPQLPANAMLYANFPNPFNPSTTIRFVTPAGSGTLPVRISIHDVRGRSVKVLHDGEMARGSMQELNWDGLDSSGMALPSGIYFTRLEIDGDSFSRKMLLLK